jgi:hypothetical protein
MGGCRRYLRKVDCSSFAMHPLLVLPLTRAFLQWQLTVLTTQTRWVVCAISLSFLDVYAKKHTRTTTKNWSVVLFHSLEGNWFLFDKQVCLKWTRPCFDRRDSLSDNCVFLHVYRTIDPLVPDRRLVGV